MRTKLWGTTACLLLSCVVLAAPVKDDPAQLPINKLPQYFNKCRNLDRWLQQGQYGRVIKTGKELLKDFVAEDPYTAFCIAAAYASMEPDPEEMEDYYEEALNFLEKAIDWGYRNVRVLETSRHFDNLRKDKEKKKEFQKLIEDLKKEVERDRKRTQRRFIPELEGKISNTRPTALILEAKSVSGKKLSAKELAGKPVLILVVRPFHDGVAKALPGLRKMSAYAKSKGISVVWAIYNYYWTPKLEKQAQAFAVASKLTPPCVMVDRTWSKRYGLLTFPSHVLVNSRGQVLYHLDGALSEEWKFTALVDLLQELGK